VKARYGLFVHYGLYSQLGWGEWVMPEDAPDPVCPVMRFDCRETPAMYLTGGMRVPKVPHAPYDPAPSDIGE
jgi:hypothetical protein